MARCFFYLSSKEIFSSITIYSRSLALNRLIEKATCHWGLTDYLYYKLYIIVLFNLRDSDVFFRFMRAGTCPCSFFKFSKEIWSAGREKSSPKCWPRKTAGKVNRDLGKSTQNRWRVDVTAQMVLTSPRVATLINTRPDVTPSPSRSLSFGGNSEELSSLSARVLIESN